MHHPGPPRFTTVGDPVELAPRDPDPDAEYAWELAGAPEGSDATLSDDSVVHFDPDVPGLYTARLDAPDGRHEVTVRAFPDVRKRARIELPQVEIEGEADRVRLLEKFTRGEFRFHEPDVEDGAYAAEFDLPPGRHRYKFVVDDWDDSIVGYQRVPGTSRPTIRLDARREGDELVVRADADIAGETDPADLDIEFYPDDRDALSAENITVVGHEARIPVDAVDDRARIHVVAVGERHSVPDVVDVGADAAPGSGLDISYPNAAPEWIQDATVYEIYVRTFAGERPPTTFAELERFLPYVESLGVDVIWLTPILQSPTEHGYHITNFFEVADDLGTREEFESFVDACHERGIRVLFDLVINHTDPEHPAYAMSAADVPEYRDWFDWIDSESPAPDQSRGPGATDQEAATYFNWSLPNFNYDSPAVRSFLLDVVDEWAPLVDGFRADVAWGVPHGFWKEVRELVREEDPEFAMLDETIPHDPEYHAGEFDTHFDSTLYYRLLEIGRGEAAADAMLDAVESLDAKGFPDRSVHLRYVENHDEDRYAEICGFAPLRAAVAATFLLPGAPMIYAGQERGMTGYRDPMAWAEGDTALTAFHRDLAALRESETVREGSVERVEYVAESDRVVAFARESEAERLVVALNFGEETETVRLPDGVDDRDLISNEYCGTGSDAGEQRPSSPDSPDRRDDEGTTLVVDDAVIVRDEK
jgi:glycosidase